MNLLISERYQTLLQRNPEPDGLKFWRGRLQNALAYQEFEAQVLSSPEFRNGSFDERL
jgi:hypothetical protein